VIDPENVHPAELRPVNVPVLLTVTVAVEPSRTFPLQLPVTEASDAGVLYEYSDAVGGTPANPLPAKLPKKLTPEVKVPESVPGVTPPALS
jgi:hypothetical protein